MAHTVFFQCFLGETSPTNSVKCQCSAFNSVPIRWPFPCTNDQKIKTNHSDRGSSCLPMHLLFDTTMVKCSAGSHYPRPLKLNLVQPAWEIPFGLQGVGWHQQRVSGSLATLEMVGYLQWKRMVIGLHWPQTYKIYPFRGLCFRSTTHWKLQNYCYWLEFVQMCQQIGEIPLKFTWPISGNPSCPLKTVIPRCD